MTTIAVRSGIMAADSRVTACNGSISRMTKLFRVRGDIVGVAGDMAAALVFCDWYKRPDRKDIPAALRDGNADFSAIVLTAGGVIEYDRWCRQMEVIEKFHAIGSGTKAALGAMHMGATARQAIAVACKIDSYTGLPVRSLTRR